MIWSFRKFGEVAGCQLSASHFSLRLFWQQLWSSCFVENFLMTASAVWNLIYKIVKWLELFSYIIQHHVFLYHNKIPDRGRSRNLAKSGIEFFRQLLIAPSCWMFGLLFLNSFTWQGRSMCVLCIWLRWLHWMFPILFLFQSVIWNRYILKLSKSAWYLLQVGQALQYK